MDQIGGVGGPWTPEGVDLGGDLVGGFGIDDTDVTIWGGAVWSRAFGPPLVPGVPLGPFPVYHCLLVVCRSRSSCHPLPFGAFASHCLRSLSIQARSNSHPESER